MSALFARTPKYYGFVRALEKESSTLRERNREMTTRNTEMDVEFQKMARQADFSLRRVGARAIRHTDAQTLRRLALQHNAAVCARELAMTLSTAVVNEQPPIRMESHEWPIRSNNARRTVMPARLLDLRQYADVLRLPSDPPIIHSTGVSIPEPSSPPQAHSLNVTPRQRQQIPDSRPDADVDPQTDPGK
jgi:hypothetical protein